MKIYFIGYDLMNPGQDYSSLFDAIKSVGTWWHCLDSTWLVKSASSAIQIRNTLVAHIDSNDKLLVACLTGEAAWRGFDEQCSSWLSNNLQFSSVDEFPSYNQLAIDYNLKRIYHQIEYVRGMVHTNGIESFWAILKRAFIGTHHKMSVKYLPPYFKEVTYRFNQNGNPDLF